MRLYHGKDKGCGKFAAHQGLCLTNNLDAAGSYANYINRETGAVYIVDIEMRDLHIKEVESFRVDDAGDWVAVGDDMAELVELDTQGIDVIKYQDIDHDDNSHTTWRLVSKKAIEACKLVGTVEREPCEYCKGCGLALDDDDQPIEDIECYECDGLCFDKWEPYSVEKIFDGAVEQKSYESNIEIIAEDPILEIKTSDEKYAVHVKLKHRTVDCSHPIMFMNHTAIQISTALYGNCKEAIINQPPHIQRMLTDVQIVCGSELPDRKVASIVEAIISERRST